jgi:hypothetical protein
MPRPIIIDERPLYLKGYKIDRLKILEFPTLPDDPQNLRYLWLWKEFPLPFLYLAVGRDSVGEKSLVVVMADGHNREEVEQTDVEELTEPYTTVFTPGIWVKAER